MICFPRYNLFILIYNASSVFFCKYTDFHDLDSKNPNDILIFGTTCLLKIYISWSRSKCNVPPVGFSTEFSPENGVCDHSKKAHG